MASATRSGLQHRIWRWHFFAGLMVIPFVVILAVTGSIYLFKPQVEAAIESRINATAEARSVDGAAVPADDLVAVALAAHPGWALKTYVLPKAPDDRTAEVELVGDGGARTLWLDTQSGAVLHDIPSGRRIMNFVSRIHGTLLGGDRGSLVVEIMASWTIILVVTGLYLWWPRGEAWWRAFVPDFAAPSGKRGAWKKVHGAVGAWIGLLVLVMLLSGLPWTQVWGAGFTRAKDMAGLKSPGQEWFVTLQSGDKHAGHNMGGNDLWSTGSADAENARIAAAGTVMSGITLQDVVDKVVPEELTPPVQVQPPRGKNGVWTVRAMPQYRPAQETVHFDKWSGAEIMRIRFADHNVADRVAAIGGAFHEGALFGWMNQVLGVIAALGVVALSVTGGVMWWRRRPKGRIGVPPMPSDRTLAAGVIGLVIALGLFLPMAGLTLLVAIGLDKTWGAYTAMR
jgi:uncharacterized iron-regulated membrane protein